MTDQKPAKPSNFPFIDRIAIRSIRFTEDDPQTVATIERAFSAYAHAKEIFLKLDPDQAEKELKGLKPEEIIAKLQDIALRKGLGDEFNIALADLQCSITEYSPQSSLIPAHSFIATKHYQDWLDKELVSRYPKGAPYSLSYAVIDVLLTPDDGQDGESLLFPISLVSKFTWKGETPNQDMNFIGPLFVLNSSFLRFKGGGFDQEKASPLDRVLSSPAREIYTADDMQRFITDFLVKVQDYRGVDGVMVEVPNRHKTVGFQRSIMGRLMTGGHVRESDTDKPFASYSENPLSADVFPEIRSGNPVKGDTVLFFLNKPPALIVSEGTEFRRCCEEARTIHRQHEAQFGLARSDSLNRILDDILVGMVIQKAAALYHR